MCLNTLRVRAREAWEISGAGRGGVGRSLQTRLVVLILFLAWWKGTGEVLAAAGCYLCFKNIALALMILWEWMREKKVRQDAPSVVQVREDGGWMRRGWEGWRVGAWWSLPLLLQAVICWVSMWVPNTHTQGLSVGLILPSEISEPKDGCLTCWWIIVWYPF